MERVYTELEELRRAFDALLAERSAEIRGMPPDREPVDMVELSELKTRLAELAEAVNHLTSLGGLNADRIAAARRSSPTPNFAEIRLLFDELAKAERPDAAERGWLMMSMEDVIRRFGPPMNVLTSDENHNRQKWEYFLSDEQGIVIDFLDGLVVAVSM